MLMAAPRRRRAAAALAALAAAAALVAFTPRGGAAPVRTPTACADSCATARDGVCDEGRPAAGAPPDTPPPGGYWNVTCDLGTDCNDCGAWTSAGTAEAAAWRPVAEILAAGYSLRAKAAAFPPNLPDRPAAFVFGYTNPLHDVDVSHVRRARGCWGFFGVVLSSISISLVLLASSCSGRPQPTARRRARALKRLEERSIP
jgi:hypothetical protein